MSRAGAWILTFHLKRKCLTTKIIELWIKLINHTWNAIRISDHCHLHANQGINTIDFSMGLSIFKLNHMNNKIDFNTDFMIRKANWKMMRPIWDQKYHLRVNSLILYLSMMAQMMTKSNQFKIRIIQGLKSETSWIIIGQILKLIS